MIYSKTSSGETICILASNEYQAIPMKFAADTPAGMPVTAAGVAAAAGTSAVGITLHDVDVSNNPNGAVVVAGIVDWTKCVANSEATATAAEMKAILPAIEFRTNIGTNV